MLPSTFQRFVHLLQDLRMLLKHAKPGSTPGMPERSQMKADDGPVRF